MLTSERDIQTILEAKNAQPHSLLGCHPVVHKGKRGLVFRAFIQHAKTCEVVDIGADHGPRYPLKRVHADGFFEGFVERAKPFGYRLRIEMDNGEIRQFYDPYQFAPTLGEQDLYLFNEGTELRIHEKLGSLPVTIDGVPGVKFAVWAPNAARVSVVGDFNQWDGRYHPMRSLGHSGIWELFIPGLSVGVKYKYEIFGNDRHLRLKTDPYGVYFEPPPHNATVVWDSEDYIWADQEWMEKRKHRKWQDEAISIYEVHLGSWKRVVEDGNRPLTYREMATELVDYVVEQGFTHVEFLPLAEHPFDGSWGYQVTGFFAPTSRYGAPQDFKYLVDKLHQHGIGVIMDWVPGHFPKDAFALAEFDGSHLYEHADPRQGYHHDWGTLIFNYGRHEVRCFLIGSALSWLERFHIDGLRVDAVASMIYLDYSRTEWIPNQYGGNENLEAIHFLRTTNDLIHQHFPGVFTIAEESTAFPGVSKPTREGGLGFDFKWNMGWMHDTLDYMGRDPVYRKHHHHQLTFAMVYQYSERFVSVFSHDEVVHMKGSLLNKMALGSIRDKARNLRALYAYMWLWPGKKTLFMGGEFGQSGEWQYDNSLDWHLLRYADHRGITQVLRDLNRLYREHPQLGRGDFLPEGFQWVNGGDNEFSCLSFLRLGEGPEDTLLVVSNFIQHRHDGYRLGVPYPGFWKEILNTDSSLYGGDDFGNGGGCTTQAVPHNGREHSVAIRLPGLSTVVFQYQGES